jgi:RNA polymerase sigma-70 factor (ECF subfamily)
MADTTDFSAFYAASLPGLCAQLYVHTGNLAEAQDVVQEAFTRAYTRWHTIHTYDDPVAWVRKVAWNLATSRWRRMRRLVALDHPDADQVVAELSPDRVALQKALATLPPRQRKAVVLHYLADLPISEIAALTGAAEGTVKSWLHRARTTLATRLQEFAAQPATGTVTTTTDERHAAADLRDAAMPHVRPPGADAARRTVRRRERTRTGAAVVLAVLMVSAALASLAGPHPRRSTHRRHRRRRCPAPGRRPPHPPRWRPRAARRRPLPVAAVPARPGQPDLLRVG